MYCDRDDLGGAIVEVPLYVFASSTSEPGMNTEELKENSWRYRNGILVDTEAVQARAGYRYAWQKMIE